MHRQRYGGWWVQNGFSIKEPELLEAALVAGLVFDSLYGGQLENQTPFREAIAMCDLPHFWNAVKKYFSPPSPVGQLGWYNNLASFLHLVGKPDGESHEQLRAAKDAGLAVRQFRKCVVFRGCCGGGFSCCECLTLLDWYIYRGDIKCAQICGAMDIGSSWWTAWICSKDVALPCLHCGRQREPVYVQHEPAALGARREAALAAIKAALRASVSQAVSDMGPGLSQALRFWARRRAVSDGLTVRLTADVLAFAAKTPALFDDKVLLAMLPDLADHDFFD